MNLKNLSEQVIVITGASSGIGLATARLAAERGARLVLAARSKDALQQLTDELTGQNRQATYVVADVSKPEEVRKIVERAEEEFGGFDTWINNAAVGMYGRIEETDFEDMKKLFDTNLWGLVHGSREAIKHLKQRGGGALINIGSTVGDRAIALQGIYSSTKHAVKAFTDALRMELEEEGAPISVTLVKPAAIDTPFPLNAKNYLDAEPQHVPPVYSPRVVAETILHCAETPVRDVFAGGGGKQNAAMGYYTPRLADKYQEKFVIPNTPSQRPPRPRNESALDRPSEHLAERGNYPGHVMKSSIYTQASLHPLLAGAAAAVAGVALAAVWRAAQEHNRRPRHWWQRVGVAR